MTVQGYVVSQLPFFSSAELKNLRLWVDAASQNAWDTGKSYLENWMTISIGNHLKEFTLRVIFRRG